MRSEASWNLLTQVQIDVQSVSFSNILKVLFLYSK